MVDHLLSQFLRDLFLDIIRVYKWAVLVTLKVTGRVNQAGCWCYGRFDDALGLDGGWVLVLYRWLLSHCNKPI
jgi:hypothetical protein